MDSKSGMNIHNVSSKSQHMNVLSTTEMDTVVTLKSDLEVKKKAKKKSLLKVIKQ